MARKVIPLSKDTPLDLIIPSGEARIIIKERINKGSVLNTRDIQNVQELDHVRKVYKTWDDDNRAILKRMFISSKIVSYYINEIQPGASSTIHPSYSGPVFYPTIAPPFPSFNTSAIPSTTIPPVPTNVPISSGRPGTRSLQNQIIGLHDRIDMYVQRLHSIYDILAAVTVGSGKIFIVHGHDEVVRETVARFIQSLGLHPIILHEQTNQGRTIIEKLEYYGDVGYAIVLLTPDDVGGKNKDTLKSRARQNVVLELGYFVGYLGREHVCAILSSDEIELPSDIFGIVYVKYYQGGEWKLELAKELKGIGFQVDMNKLL